MKRLVAGFCTAFSLYSAIPMPRQRWDRESMQYALCFFPLVGVVIGAVILAWHRFCVYYTAAPALFAAVAVLLPLLLSGGIHLDGFVDTVDALSSHAEREKKLEILKDPHVGAFGVMGCVALLLLQFGLWQQVYLSPRLLVLPASGYVLSRALNALSIATFPCARSSGLVHAFSTAAARRAAVLACGALGLAAAAVCLYQSVFLGGLLCGAVLLYFILHRRFCIREFGGNTGDLAGFLLQNLELLCLAAAAVGGLIA